ncbi:MarR family transcriptional regulator [Curtobacterium sp. MCBD17_034]|uniref:MarR family winged helix-turn-helix transcriptional regulator n=1 Tax=unclassified Curtobacterium TaxID=257496 RepID=UPI000DA6F28D|nr:MULTISPECIES: MarR family transcriptional regulator [unclassified Curtobacterium]PZF62049.1 MarR family transcriptional regulator [Curtobacterium sp. MCBD17_034]PZM34018.1 MarR family transcriptional regulator [Curtobacterium sp. MCBD17_031]
MDAAAEDLTAVLPPSAAVLASRAMLGIVAASLESALEQVTVPQLRILVVLVARGPVRAGVLAEETGASPSTLTRTVDRLERDGWVRRNSAPSSRRETLVVPTRRAIALVEDVTRRRTEGIERVLARLSDQDRAAVVRGFELFSGAAGEFDRRRLLGLGIGDERG